MYKDEEQREANGGGDGGGGGDAPCDAGKEHEEGEEVGEGGVGAMPGIFRFCGGGVRFSKIRGEGYYGGGGGEGGYVSGCMISMTALDWARDRVG